MKLCPGCDESKPRATFTKCVRREDGLQYYCKACMKLRRKPRSEGDRLTSKKWRHSNRERVYSNRRRWGKEHPERIREFNAQWREKNPGESARKAPYRTANAERIRKYVSDWRRANPDYALRRRRSAPEKVRAAKDAHRARKAGAPGRYTGADVKKQYALQSGGCFYCETPLNGQYHMDHKIPLARGGTNWPENMVCACATCNLRKNTKTDVEFFDILATERSALFGREEAGAPEMAA